MKVFVTGGTGFIGTYLTHKLVENGHQLTLLTRQIRRDRPLPSGAEYLEGDPTQKGSWQDRVADHEVIVNLAGTSIFRRWTKSAKKAIRESRILTTQNLVDALSSRQGMNTIFLSTSAVGYYGFREDEDLDEESPPGQDFLATLTVDWESIAMKAENFGARVVPTRFGIVLGKNGGALKQMLPMFKWYLGSPLGNGKQWFSWIHIDDLANIYLYLIGEQGFTGPVNCTAPHPVRNMELTKALGEALRRPTFMPAVPAFAMKIIMGEFGSILVKGQKVFPKRLLGKGFHFRFPEMRGALQDLLG